MLTLRSLCILSLLLSFVAAPLQAGSNTSNIEETIKDVTYGTLAVGAIALVRYRMWEQKKPALEIRRNLRQKSDPILDRMGLKEAPELLKYRDPLGVRRDAYEHVLGRHQAEHETWRRASKPIEEIAGRYLPNPLSTALEVFDRITGCNALLTKKEVPYRVEYTFDPRVVGEIVDAMRENRFQALMHDSAIERFRILLSKEEFVDLIPLEEGELLVKRGYRQGSLRWDSAIWHTTRISDNEAELIPVLTQDLEALRTQNREIQKRIGPIWRRTP